jgi:hypothetical protein
MRIGTKREREEQRRREGDVKLSSIATVKNNANL